MYCLSCKRLVTAVTLVSYIANIWFKDSIGFKFSVGAVNGLFNVGDPEVCVDHTSTLYVHEMCNSNYTEHPCLVYDHECIKYR